MYTLLFLHSYMPCVYCIPLNLTDVQINGNFDRDYDEYQSNVFIWFVCWSLPLVTHIVESNANFHEFSFPLSKNMGTKEKIKL